MTELADFAARLTALTDGRASAPRIRDGVMTLSLDVGGLGADQRDGLAAAIREGGMTVPGVSDVRIAMTAERRPLRILAVASGKGGVGKSTLSANLAIALHRLGFKVGLVTDGRMSGASGKVPAAIHVYPEALDGGPLARVRNGDLVRLDAGSGELSVQVDEQEFASRESEKADLNGYHHGYGRELFGWMRRAASNPEEGASFFWNHDA